VGGTGYIGYALKSGTFANDIDKPNIANRITTSVAFTIEVPSSGFSTVTGRVSTVGSYFNISISAAGKVVLTYDNISEAPETINSVGSLTIGAVNRVVCTYERGVSAKIYINGVLDTTSTLRVAESLDSIGLWIEWTVGSETIGDVMYFSDVYSNNRALHEYSMLMSNAAYYTVASEETKPTQGSYSSGLSLYSKELSDTTWKLVEGGVPISSMLYTPVIAPILIFNSSAITFFNAEGKISVYNRSSAAIVNFDNYVGQTYAQPSSGTLLVSALGIDSKYYVGTAQSSVDRFTASTGASGVFASYPTVKGIEDYNGYIAVAGGYYGGDKSYLQLWDRASLVSNQSVNVGLGELQVLGNIKGTLFGVINNFVDSSNKALGTQSMDVRVYSGGGDMVTTHKISAPTNMDGFYTNAWDKPVSQLKCTNKNAVLFYAKIPSVEGGYNEGFWSIGKNETGDQSSISLALMYDTSTLGHVYNVTSIANQIVVFHDTNKVSRLSLSPNYSGESVVITRIFNGGNSETDKQLQGVEIMHKKLTGDQSISVYKKSETDTDWVLSMTSTANNEASTMSKETSVDANGDSLGDFKEVQFKIVSTGGSSGITQFAMKYETLSNTI
jgi:hypothetical protein